MRVISQDGKWDLPYDRIVIDKSGEKIFAQSNLISSGDDNYVQIAEYSSKERAEKAMGLLHSADVVECNKFSFPQDEEIEEFF